jgi:phage major head subunit gpT-like protein
MALTPTNISALLWPGLRKIFGDEYAQYAEEYSKVFSVETSSQSYEKDQNLSSLGLVQEKPVGQSIAYDTVYQGYEKTYTNVTYGLGVAIGRETVEDNLYRNIKNMGRAQARSVRQTVEILAANNLNRAFSSSYTGGDGKEMCATDHPLLGGGTFSNELDTAADLDITSIEQALLDIQDFVDDRSLKVAVRPKTLVIHPANEFNAKMLLRSSKLPDSANNNINPAEGIMPYTTMHWLTDSDAWFIITDCPNGLTWLWRRRPEYREDNNFDAEIAKFKCTFRCSSGWTDPRGIFGSPGA